MIQQEILQNLFQVRQELEDELMDLTPAGDPVKTQQFQELFRKRDQVFTTINQVVATDFNELFDPDIDKELKALGDATSSLQALAKTFDTINSVIGTVDSALLIVAKVVAAAGKVVAAV